MWIYEEDSEEIFKFFNYEKLVVVFFDKEFFYSENPKKIEKLRKTFIDGIDSKELFVIDFNCCENESPWDYMHYDSVK